MTTVISQNFQLMARFCGIELGVERVQIGQDQSLNYQMAVTLWWVKR